MVKSIAQGDDRMPLSILTGPHNGTARRLLSRRRRTVGAPPNGRQMMRLVCLRKVGDFYSKLSFRKDFSVFSPQGMIVALLSDIKIKSNTKHSSDLKERRTP